MRNLISERHPKFDETLATVGTALYKIAAVSAKRYKTSKQELLGTAVLIMNHLLYTFDPTRNVKFFTYFLACAPKMLVQCWVKHEAEYKHCHATWGNRIEVSGLSSDTLSYLDEDKTPIQELLESLGSDVWQSLCSKLYRTDRKMLELHFKEGMTLTEIGKLLSVTRSHVSYRIYKALASIRRLLKDRKIARELLQEES